MPATSAGMTAAGVTPNKPRAKFARYTFMDSFDKV